MLAKSAGRWLTLVALSLLGIGAPALAWAVAPTPISACPYTIAASGNYVVTRDLTATGTCISIDPVGGIALDLQGHSITGNGTGYGIVCLSDTYSCTNNVIANGTVSRFAGGMVIQGHSNAVANVTSQQNIGTGR
jgi:hypothetical protein